MPSEDALPSSVVRGGVPADAIVAVVALSEAEAVRVAVIALSEAEAVRVVHLRVAVEALSEAEAQEFWLRQCLRNATA